MKSTFLKNVAAWKVYGLWVAALVSITFISGCSKGLSQDQAKEIIIQHFKYPIPITHELSIGSKILTNGLSPKWLESLKQEGLIDYTYHEAWGVNHIVSVSLTDKGKAYVAGDIKTRERPNAGQQYVEVKFAEKQFVEITGIKASGDRKEVTVEYAWKYGNLTPFSKGWRNESLIGALVGNKSLVAEKIHKAEVHMSLYNGGWRIKE